MLLKIKISWICKYSQNVLDYNYGGLNISRLKFSLITPKTAKSAKIFPSKYLGYTVTDLQGTLLLQETNPLSVTNLIQ